jgi:hypothetical protein
MLFTSIAIYAQVGIGTSNPQAELHVAGSKTGIQTLRIDDLAVTATGTNPGELSTSSTTIKKTVYIDDSGNLWSSDAYGSAMKSVVFSTPQNIVGATKTDITGATLTFTPKHQVVYLSFAVSGYNPLTCGGGPNNTNQHSWFGVHVIKDTVTVGSFVSLSATTNEGVGSVGAANNGAAQFPITVTPGVPTTIKLQGNNGGLAYGCGFTINNGGWTSYMSIMD